MGFSRIVGSSLRFGLSGECNPSVNLTHFFFLALAIAGKALNFLKPLPSGLGLLDFTLVDFFGGLPTFDPYVPFPYGIIYFLFS